MLERNNELIALNFTGIYREMGFIEEYGFTLLDFSDMKGVSLYVDSCGERELRERLRSYGPYGIHFLDNGNFHYVTRFFLEKLEEPFDLLVLDHHRDYQKPAFPGLKSCGSWLRDAFEDIPLLSDCTLILSESEREVLGETLREAREFSGGPAKEAPFREKPVYVSLDKDILSRAVAPTNWDQGEMELETLLSILDFELKKRRVIGVDICGEEWKGGEIIEARELLLNDGVNRALTEFFLKYCS